MHIQQRVYPSKHGCYPGGLGNDVGNMSVYLLYTVRIETNFVKKMNTSYTMHTL